jgi:hypothetical protein
MAFDTVFYAHQHPTDYMLSYTDLLDAVGLKYHGALITTVFSESIPSGSDKHLFTTTTVSVNYDTGSFTDSNSSGIFYINQTPKFTHVEVGYSVLLNEAQESEMFVSFPTSIALTPEGSIYTTSEGFNFTGHYGTSAPIPVSSGDGFAVTIRKFGADNTSPFSHESGVSAFWIRGIGRV